MAKQSSSKNNNVLDLIRAEVTKQFSKNTAKQAGEFSQLHYGLTNSETLRERSVQSLSAAVNECWQFVQQFKLHEPKLLITNPDADKFGWENPHTLILVQLIDMPFLIDSLRMEINRRGHKIYQLDNSILAYQRTGAGKLKSVTAVADKNEKAVNESLIYIEIEHITDAEEIADFTAALADILSDVSLVTTDYPQMKSQALELIDQVDQFAGKLIKKDQQELSDLLSWLSRNHFTFLGYEQYKARHTKDGAVSLLPVKGSELGFYKSCDDASKRMQIGAPPATKRTRLDIQNVLTFTKSPTKSRVHRPAYSDVIAIKTYDAEGKLQGEHRFIGLFTSRVYLQTVDKIPVIRRKVSNVLTGSGLHPGSHDWKELEQILETYPRDDLLQISFKELMSTSLQIFRIHERRLTRIFIRRDIYSRYYSCLVYVPRDIYSTELRVKVQNILSEELGSEKIEFNTHFSESILARTQFIVHASDKTMANKLNTATIEKRVLQAARSWSDDLQVSLTDTFGEKAGSKLLDRYGEAFPIAYRDDYCCDTAVNDIRHIEQLCDNTPLSMSFYKKAGQPADFVNFKLFHAESHLPLSEIIPVMEKLGLRVLDEHPYAVKYEGKTCWIHDFQMQYYLSQKLDLDKSKEGFKEAFAHIWHGDAENDDYNRLVLASNVPWRYVWMLRAYGAYIKQIKFGISQAAMAQCLLQHSAITDLLIALFDCRFKLDNKSQSEEKITEKIYLALEDVPSLTDDRIIRRYTSLIGATLRTNFFQKDQNGNHHSYISFKLSPRDLEDIPQPKPMYEIFVHSPRVQGVHLRGGPVARGGLRWSDRVEDFRTEVLGLVKAQQVKNAVIVPVGAKGGFVAKKLHEDMSRDEFMQEGIGCYKLFINGLLDVTDNIVNDEIVPPVGVVRQDGDDPYLVVAADKGTATFSDIANSISESRGFWLQDAFASGGSQGYDHKGMGITAKGAWVSVQRHFREIGVDVQNEDFTVIGVGDMSGDVFGNGMLLSEHIQLVAAFNHLHIFIDPNPNSAESYKERKRLFDLPRSSWTDYSDKLISKGGGVFDRKAKYINITPEMKKCFDLSSSRMTPNELLHALLKAPVDLIWNGGIGTYAKSSGETDADVGDKANDSIRVNGDQLRCKVVGEGGNLGLTQQARIEYCLNGGRCNTDFIDNAGGVDCSDHEVNIKILLDGFVASGDLSPKKRNKLLEKMTDTVSDLVLGNNYQQTQSLSLSEAYTIEKFDEFNRVIEFLESRAKLDRELEFLPDDEQLQERKVAGKGLTRPELAVLLSYGKALLKEELLDLEITEDPHASQEFVTALPQQLMDQYGDKVYGHKLKGEIIATQIANHMMNDMGLAYLHHLETSTGFHSVQIAKAYLLARDVFHMQDIWKDIEALDNKIDAEIQRNMMLDLQRLVRRASRWFLRNRRKSLNIDLEIDAFAPSMKQLLENMGNWLHGVAKDNWQGRYQGYLGQGVPESLAVTVASNESLYMALGAIEVAKESNYPLKDVVDAYCLLGEELHLYWFTKAITGLPVTSHWQALARDAYRDDVDWQVRSLAISLLNTRKGKESLNKSYARWYEENEVRAQRWKSMLSELQSSDAQDYSMFTVAIRELFDLAKVSSLN